MRVSANNPAYKHFISLNNGIYYFNFLLFFKNIPFKVTILFLFNFLFLSNLYSQVIIKEKLKITHDKIKNNNNFIATDLGCTISLSFLWDKPDYEASLCTYYSGGTYCSDWTKGGNIGTTVIGNSIWDVSFRVSLNLEENVECNFSYSVSINGVVIHNGSGKVVGKWLYPVYVYIDPSDYSLEKFNDYRNVVEYSIGSNRLCYKKPVSLSIYTNINCENKTELNITKNSLVKIKLAPSLPGIELYEYETKKSVGTEIIKKLEEVWNLGYQITVNEDYYNTKEETLYVYTEIEGRSRKDSIVIAPSYYVINTDNTSINIIAGDSVLINAYIESSDICTSPKLPDSIKFNIRIIEGSEHASLKDLSQGYYGKELKSLPHNKGNINFLFIADSSFSNDEKIVLVEISSTSESIEPLELEFKIKPNRIIVGIEPSTISADDTALIKIKYKDIDGTIREFQDEQVFIVSTDTEYGYFLYEDEITGEEIAQNEILYKKLPLKFVAYEDIPYP